MIKSDPTVAGIHFQDESFFSSGFPCDTFLSINDHTNQNCHTSHNYIILLHHKLGRVGFQGCHKRCQILQDPSQEQIIKPTTSHVTTCYASLCASCQMEKQNWRTPDWRVAYHTYHMVLFEVHLRPVGCVSIDQYIPSVPGRLPHTKGGYPTN